MTFLEKAKLESKEKRIKFSEDGLPRGCPYKYGYEEDHSCSDVECIECWDREMPDTEEFVEPKCTFETEVQNAYNKGLNDAWEVAKKFFADMKETELEKIFGEDWSFYKIMDMTPQEALAKLKAYEEAQNKIEIGDVITYAGEKGLVLDCPYNKFLVLTNDGWIQEWYECDVEKTGKYIDIQSILEQIGE